MKTDWKVLAGVAVVAGLVGFGVGVAKQDAVIKGPATEELIYPFNPDTRKILGVPDNMTVFARIGNNSACVTEGHMEQGGIKLVTYYTGPDGFQKLVTTQGRGETQIDPLFKELCGHLFSEDQEINTD